MRASEVRIAAGYQNVERNWGAAALRTRIFWALLRASRFGARIYLFFVESAFYVCVGLRPPYHVRFGLIMRPRQRSRFRMRRGL